MPIFHIFKTDISSFEWEGGHLSIIHRYLHSGLNIQGVQCNVNIVDKTCINAKHKEVIVLPFYAVCRSAVPLQLRGILTFLLRSGKITARWPENLMWNGEKCKQQIGNSTLRFWEIREIMAWEWSIERYLCQIADNFCDAMCIKCGWCQKSQ